MRAAHLDAFLASAFEVLGQQAAALPERGSPVLRSGETLSSRELTMRVALQGDLVGVIFYSMSLATAAKLTAVIAHRSAGESGEPNDEATVQLARISVAAGIELLAQQGCQCVPADPVIVHGFGEPLTDVSPVLVVPVFTEYGDIDIGVALNPPGSLPAGVPLILARQADAHQPAAEHIEDDSVKASAA